MRPRGLPQDGRLQFAFCAVFTQTEAVLSNACPYLARGPLALSPLASCPGGRCGSSATLGWRAWATRVVVCHRGDERPGFPCRGSRPVEGMNTVGCAPPASGFGPRVRPARRAGGGGEPLSVWGGLGRPWPRLCRLWRNRRARSRPESSVREAVTGSRRSRGDIGHRRLPGRWCPCLRRSVFLPPEV